MSGNCQSLLLRALRARMIADAGLIAEVSTRVYETVPADAVFPLIALNNASFDQNDTDTSSGATHEIVYSIYTRGEAARVDARRIGEALTACLDRCGQFLTVTGHKVVIVRIVRSIVFRADDQTNGMAQGVFTFEAITEQIAAASGA